MQDIYKGTPIKILDVGPWLLLDNYVHKTGDKNDDGEVPNPKLTNNN